MTRRYFLMRPAALALAPSRSRRSQNPPDCDAALDSGKNQGASASDDRAGEQRHRGVQGATEAAAPTADDLGDVKVSRVSRAILRRRWGGYRLRRGYAPSAAHPT